MTDLPTPDQARAAAARTIGAATAGGPDPLLRGATMGDPMVVHTLAGVPSYVLVPLRLPDGGHGFVRVMPDGVVAAAGRFRGRGASDLDPADVADTARSRLKVGESAAEPVLVHDGPPGREAWLVATRIGGGPGRWLLVTPGGVHERRAGDIPDPDLE